MIDLYNFLNNPVSTLIIYVPLLLITFYLIIKKQHMDKLGLAAVKKAALSDPMWNPETLEKTVKKIVECFHQARSEFNLESCASLLTDSLKSRVELEFAVLKNEHRSVRREGLYIHKPKFCRVNEAEGSFIASVGSSATTVYLDVLNNANLFESFRPVYEYWKFVKRGDRWLADNIQLSLEACEYQVPTDSPKPDYIDAGNSRAAKDIYNFAYVNNLYFDPSFGCEMLPDKGALFDSILFYNARVTDHVIGKFHDKIVEFYRFEYPVNHHVFTIAQAILPKEYQNILIQSKQIINWPIKNLNKIETESEKFNREFNLYAHDVDQANSFELLAPNFMEKVSSLEFQLSIEVIGNYLFLYTEDRYADYNEMLKILNWAFDEMKM